MESGGTPGAYGPHAFSAHGQSEVRAAAGVSLYRMHFWPHQLQGWRSEEALRADQCGFLVVAGVGECLGRANEGATIPRRPELERYRTAADEWHLAAGGAFPGYATAIHHGVERRPTGTAFETLHGK